MEEKKGRVFGYARVSSKEQNLSRQIIELSKIVPNENIIVDKQSGENLNRSGYQALKGVLGLRKGDTLIVKSLDRLSRNKQDIKDELEWFKDHDIHVKILNLPTTMADYPEGQEWIGEMINNIMIEVLASFAEQERRVIKERQREGINAAKKKGKHLGRPRLTYPDDWSNIYLKWVDGEITARKAMEILGLKRTSFYNLVKEFNTKEEHIRRFPKSK